jgi:hypothetical protein
MSVAQSSSASSWNRATRTPYRSLHRSPPRAQGTHTPAFTEASSPHHRSFGLSRRPSAPMRSQPGVWIPSFSPDFGSR